MRKTLSKKVFLILLLLIISISLFGCARITSGTRINDDGTIDEYVSIVFDTNKLNETEITDIKTKSKNVAQYFVNYYNNMINEKLMDFMLSMDERMIYMSYVGKMQLVETSENNKYTVGVKYASIDIYKFFYSIPEDSSSEPEIEEHFLYNKYVYDGATIFETHKSLYEQLYDMFKDDYSEIMEDTELIFSYTADNKREHSNADYVEFKDGKYNHIWILKNNNGEFNIDRDVVYYYNIANQSNCILLSIGVVLGVGVVLTVIGVIVEKSKKKKASK